MGKVFVIKNADFSEVSVDRVTQYIEDDTPVLWFDGNDFGSVASQWKNKGSFSENGSFLNYTINPEHNYITLTQDELAPQGLFVYGNPLENIDYGPFSGVAVVNSGYEFSSIFGINEYTGEGTNIVGKWMFQIQEEECPGFWYRGDDGETYESSSHSITPGKHIIGFSRDDNSEMTFYVDGINIGSVTFDKNILPNPNLFPVFSIGGDASRIDEAFKGDIYCCKLWDKELSADDMENEFNALNIKYNLGL